LSGGAGRSGTVDSIDKVSKAVTCKRKQEPMAASASKYKEQQPARALGVASEDSGSDSDTQVKEAEEELCFTVAQG